MRLKPPKKAGQGAGERIVEPGDMLIFVSGHYPIYGTQILYFSDPVLSKRAALPPPVKFMSIEDGTVRPQQPPERGPNVISRAEPGVSAMEQAFLAELAKRPTSSATAGTPPGFIEQLTIDQRET